MMPRVYDVMSQRPIGMPASASVLDAARTMRDAGIGDVIVLENDQVCGIITDRDIVVRAIAAGHDPATLRLGDICSSDVVTVSPTDTIEDAVRLMREHAVRRLPVVEYDNLVGIVSLGDLAIARDPTSTLGDISATPPDA